MCVVRACTMQAMQMLSQNVTNLICSPLLHGEFDPGSGRTLAACLIHASRADRRELAPLGQRRTGE